MTTEFRYGPQPRHNDPDYISAMEHFESLTHEQIHAGTQRIDAGEILQASLVWLEAAGTLTTSMPLTRNEVDRAMNGADWQGAAADAADACTRGLAESVEELSAIMGEVGARLGALAAAAEAVKLAVVPPGNSGPIGTIARILEAAHVLDAKLAQEALRQEALLAMNMIYKPAYTAAGTAVPALPELPGGPESAPTKPSAPQSIPQQDAAPNSAPPQDSSPHTAPPQGPTPHTAPPQSPTPHTAPPQSPTPHTAPPQSPTPDTAPPQSPTPHTAPPQSPTPDTAPPQGPAPHTAPPQGSVPSPDSTPGPSAQPPTPQPQPDSPAPGQQPPPPPQSSTPTTPPPPAAPTQPAPTPEHAPAPPPAATTPPPAAPPPAPEPAPAPPPHTPPPPLEPGPPLSDEEGQPGITGPIPDTSSPTTPEQPGVSPPSR